MEFQPGLIKGSMLSEVVFLRNKMANYILARAEILGTLLSALFPLYFKLVSLFSCPYYFFCSAFEPYWCWR